MPIAIEQTIQVMQIVVQSVPLGTNLSLLHLLWSMLSGSFLRSRGAIFSALVYSGFTAAETRRSWQALRYGMWRLEDLLQSWREYVHYQSQWQPRMYEGYRPVAVDMTAFWRLQLKGWLGKYFHGLANRMLRGVGFGLVAEVGQIGEQRIPLLRKVIRAHPKDLSDSKLKAMLLDWVGRHLADDEVVLFDAGAHIADMQAAAIKRYVIRLAGNCTARRNELPAYSGKGRPPEYGRRVRPLKRRWKERTIVATKPDFSTSFEHEHRTIRVLGWSELVPADKKPHPENETFSILVFLDPLYQQALVLGTNVALQPATAFKLYLDRWPVEQIPLAAKQMLGLHRQFVFAPESCQRLPELALLAGNILTYLAAVLPPLPTGFWDQRPKKRPAACGESWPRLIFQKIASFLGNFEKSVQLPATCRRVWPPTGAENSIPDRQFGICDGILSRFVKVQDSALSLRLVSPVRFSGN
jgi:hypothetical protein